MKLGKTNIILNQIIYTKLQCNHIIKYSNKLCTCMRCGADLLTTTRVRFPSWNARVGKRPPVIPSLRPEVGIRNSYPRCAIPSAHQQPRRRLGTIPACAEPMRHNNLASLGSGAIRVKLHFTRIFNQHNYNTNIYNIYTQYISETCRIN